MSKVDADVEVGRGHRARATKPRTTGSYGPSAWAIVAAATAAAVAVWEIANAAGVPMEAESGGSVRHVGVGAVAFAAIVSGLAAVISRAVVIRRPGGLRWWVVLGSGVMVLSLFGTLAATTTATELTLIGLHLTVGLVLIAGLWATARAR